MKVIIEVDMVGDVWGVIDAVYHVPGVVSVVELEYDGHGGYEPNEASRRPNDSDPKELP